MDLPRARFKAQFVCSGSKLLALSPSSWKEEEDEEEDEGTRRRMRRRSVLSDSFLYSLLAIIISQINTEC